MGSIGADDLTDSVGTDLADADSVVIGEPGIATGWLAGAVTDVYRWLDKPDNRTLSQQFNELIGLDPDSPVGITAIDLLSMAPFVGDFVQTSNTQHLIQNVVDIAEALLTGDDSLSVLHAHLEDIASLIGAQEQFPTPAPAAWGDVYVPAIFGWDVDDTDYVGSAGTISFGTAQERAYYDIDYALAIQGLRIRTNPDFTLIHQSGHDLTTHLLPWGGGYIFPPSPVDWSDWTPGTSLVAFLNAQTGEETWTMANPDTDVVGTNYAYLPGGGGATWYFRCEVQEWQLPFVSGKWQSTLQTKRVWPGLDGVTLGEAIPITDTIAVEEPCDGVLLAIATMESGGQYTQVGDYKLFKNLGRYSFLTDNGQTEGWTGIPSDNCVLMPERMLTSSGILLHFYRGVTGTVTPFSINP